MEDMPPVKLYNAPNFMGSAAIDAMVKHPITINTEKMLKIVRFMFSSFFLLVYDNTAVRHRPSALPQRQASNR
jgi:hypothetical protein